MSKKMGLLSCAVLIVVVILIAFFVKTTSTPISNEKSQVAYTGSREKQNPEIGNMKDSAKALIGSTLSMEEIKEKLGKYKKFNMSSDGCERGVYAGRFYYEGFNIFSRTYNKGKTFHIVSVN